MNLIWIIVIIFLIAFFCIMPIIVDFIETKCINLGILILIILNKTFWFFSKQRREEKKNGIKPLKYTRVVCPFETIEVYNLGDGKKVESMHCWVNKTYPVSCFCYKELCFEGLNKINAK